jgi:glycoprotein endo-alpha-1,2-mannosidase
VGQYVAELEGNIPVLSRGELFDWSSAVFFFSADVAAQHGLLWAPCAGPGYDDHKVRPWNERNTKAREAGGYLRRMLTSALASSPAMVGLTSFNEWHEGAKRNEKQRLL